MGKHIHKLTIKGFKSIRCLEDFELGNLNVMIGANGAGKSNFVQFVLFFKSMIENWAGNKGAFDSYIKKHGGADKLLYQGLKMTKTVEITISMCSDVQFSFSLPFTSDNSFDLPNIFAEGAGLATEKEVNENFDALVNGVLQDWIVYHFHDTSDTAGVKRPCSKRDNEYLRADGGNLAAFLYKLKKKNEPEYQRIRETIQLAAPFFDDFLLRESIDNPDETLLEWRQKHSDYPFHPSQLSDGTLRFMCLTTALLQPEPPSIILLDEPELGLHPYALGLLSEMIKKASHRTQVIVSTQSASLIDYFEPADIIVVDRKDGESTFKRLNASKLKDWLEDYTLGQLWQKNIIEGGPVYE